MVNSIGLRVTKSVDPEDGTPFDTESGFVGVDPVYQNFANDTDDPSLADEGRDDDSYPGGVEAYVSSKKDSESDKKESSVQQKSTTAAQQKAK